MKKKMILLYVVTMVTILGLVIFTMQTMGYSIIEQQTNLRLLSLAASKSNQIANLVEQDFERASLIASRTQMRKSLIAYKEGEDPKNQLIRMHNIIKDAAHSVESIQNIDIVNLQGRIITSTNESKINQHLINSDVYIKGKENRYFSEIMWDVDGTPFYHLSMPLYHTEDQYTNLQNAIGLLVVEMSVERILDILKDTTGLGNTGDISFLSLESEIMTCIRLKNQNGEGFYIEEWPVDKKTSDQDGIRQQILSVSGEDIFATFNWIEIREKQWGILVKIDQNEIMEPYLRMYGYLSVAFGALTILGIFVFLLGIRYSFYGIQKLLEGAEEFGKGNLDYHIEVQSKDEIRRLADSYNSMASKLKMFRDQMENLSFTDQLTGIGNRRLFEEEMIRLDAPHHFPLTILMGDVNGLKLVNDAFGHTLGDQLLQMAASVLMEACSRAHVICRMGGDEFVILMPETTTIEAKETMERIQKKLEETRVGRVELSVSFGLATKNTVKEPLGEVVQQAEEEMYRNKLLEGKKMKERTIKAIIDTFFESDPNYRVHAENVAYWSYHLGEKQKLSKEKLSVLTKAAKLHDLGKITFDQDIMNKSTVLTSREWMEMKRHPENGYRILDSVSQYKEVAEIILSHHEHWDGTGYPRNLKGEEIPLESRIIAIAESYDVMTTTQPYREAMSREYALKELQKNAGSIFDPVLVQQFLSLP
ncbi:diguanylate cyclase (GGDEF) domain-containing protein [Tindallia magadiensis]|uniref:Diguanylate cyclase (GGDEF) domain-containing protein n=1 Tax=Tindallia magadiensis TaxID=69895 RepID=A0A1I3C6J2_9FIRM|nr:HD domain-containing phosphohydrolase [Tindallia magadiensis]SFH69789.1 diguanylate cyclase (GGDEF) domain-containing protein [Tindallia magadiensis]